jgi:hypothetical protein
MKISSDDFSKQKRKALTLIGMSGLGKTYLSNILAQAGWVHYSCDEVIGTRSLADYLDAPVTKDDLSPLSRFLGKLGNPTLGGLPLYEFKRRQKLYYDAERAALKNIPMALAETRKNFVHDSTGSFCEIMDAAAIDAVGQATLVIYIKANAEEEKIIQQRALDYPKPLFFPPSQFDNWLETYMAERSFNAVEQINPDDFSRWVFPRLFESRLPKYQALADRYGITLSSEALNRVKNAADFLDIVGVALLHQNNRPI